jgi:CspA family cold shock protein
MKIGSVVRLARTRGFGFIASGGDEYFFHASGLRDGLYFDHLIEGTSVWFEIEASDRGPRAVNVRLVDGLR